MAAFGSYGTPAVDVFFVLSGFVIGYVTQYRETNIKDYFLSRAARIYSVAAPAIMFCYILDKIGATIDFETYRDASQGYGPGVLARSITFLNETWDVHRFPGTNSPYWSLGFEVVFYVVFATYYFFPGKWRWICSGVVLLIAGPKVAVLFPAWLLGFMTYHLCSQIRLSRAFAILLLVLPIMAFSIYISMSIHRQQQFMPLSLEQIRVSSILQDYFICILFCVHLVGFAALAEQWRGALSSTFVRTIRWAAGATFSIYLVHLPVMTFVSALSPWPKQSKATLVLLLIGTLLICLAFSEVSERRKAWWRQLFEAIVGRVERMFGRMTLSKAPEQQKTHSAR